MKKILIYGCTQQAQQLCYYVEREQCAEVTAFVVDPGYRTVHTLSGHPVITFDEALREHPPGEYEFAVSFAYQHMIHDREEKCLKCRAAGYRLYNFVSNYAAVFARELGEGNIIYPGCNIGCNVTIGDGNFFETGVTIAHDTHIGHWNFFAPAAVTCGSCRIGDHNFLGANCTVMDSAVIGTEVLVGAGAVVRNTEDHSVYFAPRAVKWDKPSIEMKI